MTITEAASALRRKKVSSAELTVESLGRIKRLEPSLNAFLNVLEEEARRSARQADEELASGLDRGPLHGLPVALKDVFHMKGVKTTGGSKLFANYVPGYDSAVTEKLRAAGAVIVGKTNMHELAFGVTSNNPHYGAVRNPWNLDRIPGGSSGGSGSAVSADVVFMATGTDTGGSVRIPASYCGTVGLKPTSGRISRFGILPFDYTLDHAGILTRTVRDTAVTLNFLAGYDSRDHTSSPQPVEDYSVPSEVSIRDLRFGWIHEMKFQAIDTEVAEAVANMVQTAQSLGARLVPVNPPEFAAINAVHRLMLHAEASAVLEPYLAQRDQFSHEILAMMQQGLLLAATDYVNAQRLRRLLIEESLKIFDEVDFLITPTLPIAAPKIGANKIMIGGEENNVRLATTSLVRAGNLLGWPAISIPCGFNKEGLPLGLQIMAKPFAEALVLRVAAALEDATDFHKKLPSILGGSV